MIETSVFIFDAFSCFYLIQVNRYKFKLAVIIKCNNKLSLGYAVTQLVEALHYKSEGRGFDSRWYHCSFSLT